MTTRMSSLHSLHLSSLLLAALALCACSAPRSPSSPAAAELVSRPDGVARVLASHGDRVVFEGQDEAQGAVFPDGRIWMLDRGSGELLLLTKPADFGKYFFASGAAFSPDGRTVYTKVNFTGDGENLYLIDLASGGVSYLVDAQELGLAEIVEESLLVSPDGLSLAFAAYGEETLDAPQPNGENFVWRQGVYAFDLADPAGSLRLVRQSGALGTGPGLRPAFDDRGRLQAVGIGAISAGWWPGEGRATEVQDLLTLPPRR